MTIKDYYILLTQKEETQKRFSGIMDLYNEIIARFPARASMQLNEKNTGVFVEMLLTGKPKDNAQYDFKNYDIKTITTKTGAHYNSATSKNKTFINIFINSKGFEIEKTNTLYFDKKPNRVEYKTNYGKGQKMSLNELLNLINE